MKSLVWVGATRLVYASLVIAALSACGSGGGGGTSGGQGSSTHPTWVCSSNCSSSGGGTGGAGSGALMGGSIQKALNLSATVSLFAGSPTGVSGKTNATGTAALFTNPAALTTDGTNLYVADKNNNEIRKVVIGTAAVSLLAGSPTGASGMANGAGTAATFFAPLGITTDGTNLYVADMGNNQIREIVIATGAVTLLAGSPTGAPGMANGTGTAATFNGPCGITTDNTNLYIADCGNNQIRKIVIATGAVTLLAGSPTGLGGMANGTGTAATFNLPYGITTDGTNLYVSDELNNQIRKIVIATGAVTLLAGSPTGAAGWTNGTGTAALFSMPGQATTDGTNLYVSDIGNNEIRQIVISTAAVTLLAGSSTAASGLTNGTGSAATFFSPAGLAADGVSLYENDYGNNEIRKIQ